MPKFIAIWNAGYGESSEVVEAASREEAIEIAYECCMDDVNSNISYRVVEYTKENLLEYNLEDNEEYDE